MPVLNASPAHPTSFPRRPLGVVFDLDGTLIDSEALVYEGYRAAADQLGLSLSHEQFLSCVGQHRAATEATLRSYFGDFPLPVFFDAVSAHIGEAAAPLKPGVEDLLAHLDEAGLPAAIATSSGPPWVERHLRAHGLTGRFQAVVTREDVAHGKPHPEPYLKAAAALELPPFDVLAIEDSPTGLASASAAGLMCVMAPDLVPPTAACRTRALHIVEDLFAVLALLKRSSV